MQFRRRLSPSAKVDLIPMIDVVFQLVVFFMFSSTFIQTPGISMVLPESSTAEPVVMTRLVVTIVSSEAVFLNKDQYTLETFENALQAIEVEERDEIKSVVVEGDQAVSYTTLVSVIDILRKNDFTGINLRMREKPE